MLTTRPGCTGFEKKGPECSTDYGAYIQQGGWVLRGNSFRDYERAVSILSGADNVTICGNDFRVTTIASTQPQIIAAANSAVIKENVFRGVYRAIHLTGTSNHAYNNTEIGCSVASLDAGSASVKTQPAF